MSETKTPSPPDISIYFYPKKFTCPVCEKEFETRVVRESKLRAIGSDSDFLARYKDIDPNHYEVLCCPDCGYAALTTYFSNVTEKQQMVMKKALKKTFKQTKYSFPYTLDEVITRYEKALECAELLNVKVSQKAFIHLRLAWILRVAGERSDMERNSIKMAYDGLQEAYSNERFPLGNMDETTAKYLIADLARRLGKMGEAMRWVADVVVARGISPSIKDRAIRLKDMVREGKTD